MSKQINIHESKFGDPKLRSQMSLFNFLRKKLDISQGELFKKLYEKSLKEIKEDYDFKQGNCQEFSLDKKTTLTIREIGLIAYETANNHRYLNGDECLCDKWNYNAESFSDHFQDEFLKVLEKDERGKNE